MSKIKYLGVGFNSKGKYKTNSKTHKAWKGMIERCYLEKLQDKYPTYKGCSVIEEWHDFQVFAEWFETYYIEKWALDKDILIKGNKIYSPKTCCFVPQEVNNLFIKHRKHRGNLPIGVLYCDMRKKFRSQICKNGKKYQLGSFDTSDSAFAAYKEAKEEYIKELADKYSYELPEQTYWALCDYKVDITD